eukprot:4339472-Prymnesium_polylepis.1
MWFAAEADLHAKVSQPNARAKHRPHLEHAEPSLKPPQHRAFVSHFLPAIGYCDAKEGSMWLGSDAVRNSGEGSETVPGVGG